MQYEYLNVEKVRKSTFSAFIGFVINMIIASVILYIWKGKDLPNYLLSIFTVESVVETLGLALISVILALFCIWIGIILKYISFPRNKYTEEILVIIKQPYGPVLISFGAGISEEILFRGAIFGVLLTSLDNFTAIVLTALIFTFIHIPQYGKNLLFNTIIALLGVLFSFLYVYTNSLLAPMVAHILYNYVICLWIKNGYLKLKNTN